VSGDFSCHSISARAALTPVATVMALASVSTLPAKAR